jgi:hypothetical protein
LNIIAESSGYDPKFRSPFGKVAGGLLKAEESFIAEDLARLKALRKMNHEDMQVLWKKV